LELFSVTEKNKYPGSLGNLLNYVEEIPSCSGNVLSYKIESKYLAAEETVNVGQC
jgi:hypothetical protein